MSGSRPEKLLANKVPIVRRSGLPGEAAHAIIRGGRRMVAWKALLLWPLQMLLSSLGILAPAPGRPSTKERLPVSGAFLMARPGEADTTAEG